MESQSWRDGSALCILGSIYSRKLPNSILKVFSAVHPSPYSLSSSPTPTLFKPSCSIILTPFVLPVFYPSSLETLPTNSPLLLFWLLWVLQYRYKHAKFQILSTYEKGNTGFVFLGLNYLTWDGAFQIHSLIWKFNNSTFLYRRIIFYFIYVAHFHYLLISC